MISDTDDNRVLEPNGRTCRVCDRDKLCSPKEAAKAFPSYPWGQDTDLLDDADRVCSFCKSAFYRHGKRTDDGETAYWVRVVPTNSLANRLATALNDSRTEARERITAGRATPTEGSGLQ